MNNLRKKLFDGIESIFYNEEYIKTHWRLKVDMCVDEVLTHILNELPEVEVKGIGLPEYHIGYNHCVDKIKYNLTRIPDELAQGYSTGAPDTL